MQSTCLIDGFGPLPLSPVQSVGELCGVVQRADAENLALYPVGGGGMLGLGNRPSRAGLAVDVRPLHQLIDYPARDMTITVQAGITIAELRKLLAPEHQQLPIDVPAAESATLGGILAANVSGSRRYGYGTLRDYLLGFSAVNDAGEEIKAGGRVVKNVAGYDLCKLFIGSLGTLGIITQATLKLRPVPEEQALVCLACRPEQLDDLLEQLRTSRTRPMCIDLLNEQGTRWLHEQVGANGPDGLWTVVVGFDGNEQAVKWQVQQLVVEMRSRYSLEAYVNSATYRFWQALAELPVAADERTFSFKANLLPSGTAAFCRQANCADLTLRAHAGNGIVVGHFAGMTLERAIAVVADLRQHARKYQGSVIVLRCPPAWKDTLSVWGPPPANAWLMRDVKKALDPKGRFNPGRFIDGI